VTYGLFHVGALVGLWLLPFDATAGALVLSSYSVRLVAVTAGFHRYFSHHAYAMGRLPQFLVALVATMAWQRGPLWWVSHHRLHHRAADTPDDPHRPADGFLHASFLWVFKHRATRLELVPDWAGVSELALLDRWYAAPPVLLAVALTAAFGASGLVHGFLVPTLLCWHCIGAINTLGHARGTRDFTAGDASTNHPVLALLTFGEGWHNGHHAFPRSARHGLAPGQLDLTYLLLRGLAAVGVVRSVWVPSPEDVAARRAPSRA
jgi:stearoyl-CoA desaturase (delta-9 desaturase)